MTSPGSNVDVTLPYAVGEAVGGGQTALIEFAPTLAGQTILLANSDWDKQYGPTAFVIVNGADITIDGSGAPGLCYRGTRTACLAIGDGCALSLENLTVQNGLAFGGTGGATWQRRRWRRRSGPWRGDL